MRRKGAGKTIERLRGNEEQKEKRRDREGGSTTMAKQGLYLFGSFGGEHTSTCHLGERLVMLVSEGERRKEEGSD